MNTPILETQNTVPLRHRLWTVGTLTYTTSGLLVLFCWLLWGDFAWAMRDRAIPTVVQFLLKKFNTTDLLAGVLLGSLPSAISVFLGPVISWKSDRLRSRWGRRIAFLMISTPFAVLGMVGLAFSPQIGTEIHKWLGHDFLSHDFVVIFCLGVFWSIFEVACIVSGAVFSGLVNDVVPTAVVGRFCGLFRILSLVAGIIFTYCILGHAKEYYVWIFLGVGALYGFSFTLLCLNVKEGKYPAPPADLPDSRPGFITNLRIYFRECYGNRYYVIYFIAGAIGGMVAMPVNLYGLFYAQSINMSLETYGKCHAFSYVISLILAYPLGALADRIHPLRLGIIAQVSYGIACLWGGLSIHDTSTFMIAFIGHVVLSGTIMTSFASLGQRLLPRAKFAQYASAGGILGAFCGIIASPLIGQFLDLTQHNYRITFFLGSAFAFLAAFLYMRLHRHFLRLGGPKNYVAPL